MTSKVKNGDPVSISFILEDIENSIDDNISLAKIQGLFTYSNSFCFLPGTFLLSILHGAWSKVDVGKKWEASVSLFLCESQT
jgi:hypothetical protein